jgi:hypothetical protein
MRYLRFCIITLVVRLSQMGISPRQPTLLLCIHLLKYHAKLFNDTKILLQRCKHKLLSVYFVKYEPFRKMPQIEFVVVGLHLCGYFFILILLLCEVLTASVV